MKKIFKTLLILIINTLVFSAIFFCADFGVYKYYAKHFYDSHPKSDKLNEFKYMPFFPKYFTDLKNFFNGENNLYSGREPDGLEYKNKIPITVFGCSYAFGQYLDYHQTFSHKLAHILKRPVYNRAVTGGTFNVMYFQVLDKGSTDFYNDVPPSDTVIYILIHDHFRRSLLNYFNVMDYHVLPHYTYKKSEGKFVLDNYDNKFSSFFNSLYLVKHFNHIYAQNHSDNIKDAEKMTDIALMYFILCKKELERRWKNKVNFVVVFYDNCPSVYMPILKDKLDKNGFKTITVSELSNIDLNSEEFLMKDNFHPKEKAWEILTPLIAKEL